MKNKMANREMADVINPDRVERSQPDRPMLTIRLMTPMLYPEMSEFQSRLIFAGSGVKGRSGCKPMVRRHPAITETSRLHAASADEAISRETIRFSDVKITTLKSKVAETPPRKVATNDICSATAVT